jgi:cell wall-associated NlpC family hydrolase
MRDLFLFLLIITVFAACSIAAKPQLVYKKEAQRQQHSKQVYSKDIGSSAQPPEAAYTKTSPPMPGKTSRTFYAAKLGYSVQVGAFNVLDNAEKITNLLEDYGYDPYYYKDNSGLFKIRFGNFGDRSSAELKAGELILKGLIDDYFIISPGDYPIAATDRPLSDDAVRNSIVKSARSYIGVPYAWGGNSRRGIDCSGLTQAVYNLNGFSIPRTSSEQYNRGGAISKDSLRPGDLVFFATSSKKVSHVGIYAGNNSFIHAPSKGKTVTVTSLSDPYFSKTYVGARSYI